MEITQEKINFEKIIILGLGLIGGSLARAVRQHNLAKEIWAYDVDDAQISDAIEAGVVNKKYNFAEKFGDNDLIVIAAPLSKYKDLLAKIIPLLSEKSIVIDLGSVKNFIGHLEISQQKLKNFIPCHPIAGSDKTGFANSSEKLFAEKKLIITPFFSDQNTTAKIISFWQTIGAIVELMDAENHDRIFALTSHLPQLLSFACKNSTELAIEISNPIIQKHRRLENSNIGMWRDIFFFNQKNLGHYLDLFLQNLAVWQNNLEIANKNEITKLLNAGRIFAEELQLEKPPISTNSNNNLPANLLARLVIILSFLQISDLTKVKNNFGSGIRDFMALIAYLELEKTNAEKFLQQRNFLLSHLKKFQTILNYDFPKS